MDSIAPDLESIGFIIWVGDTYIIRNRIYKEALKLYLRSGESKRAMLADGTASDLVVDLVVPSLGILLMIVMAIGGYVVLSGVERIMVMAAASVMGLASFVKLIFNRFSGRED